MRVALDGGPLLDPPTGVGRYVGELSDALEVMGVDVRRYAFARSGTPPAHVVRKKIPARVAQWGWQKLGRPAVDRLVGPTDVIHGTNFVLPPGPGAGVVTVHDLSFARPDAFPGADRLQRLVPWSLSRAHAVITPTHAVADEVCEEYDVDPEVVSVTHLGVSPVFFGASPLSDVALAGMGIARPFVLATGTDAPRKNLRVLLDAWVAARGATKGWTLVLAGPSGWGPRFGRTDDVHPLGWVGDETLPGLMAAADIFCFPSLYEGFGMPPLEAMAAGTACIVGRYSAADEVLGDAPMFVDAQDHHAVADAVVDLIRDPAARKTLALRGRARASGFTWERTARATRAAYAAATERAGAGPGR